MPEQPIQDATAIRRHLLVAMGNDPTNAVSDAIHRVIDAAIERESVLQARIDAALAELRRGGQTESDRRRAADAILAPPRVPEPTPEREWTPGLKPRCFRCGGVVWNVDGTTQRIDGKLQTVHIACSRLRRAPFEVSR